MRTLHSCVVWAQEESYFVTIFGGSFALALRLLRCSSMVCTGVQHLLCREYSIFICYALSGALSIATKCQSPLLILSEKNKEANRVSFHFNLCVILQQQISNRGSAEDVNCSFEQGLCTPSSVKAVVKVHHAFAWQGWTYRIERCTFSGQIHPHL